MRRFTIMAIVVAAALLGACTGETNLKIYSTNITLNPSISLIIQWHLSQKDTDRYRRFMLMGGL